VKMCLLCKRSTLTIAYERILALSGCRVGEQDAWSEIDSVL
jgi:hypothetical protein